MDRLSLQNPVFTTYAIAASLMILKTLGMAWLTVWQMLRLKSGYRAPEDLRRTLINPAPHPGQTLLDERVERFRRIHQNDLENVPFFLAAGLLFVLTAPSLLTAQILFYGYAVSRFLHFVAYATRQTHDLRATLWTVGVLIVIYMTLQVLAASL